MFCFFIVWFRVFFFYILDRVLVCDRYQIDEIIIEMKISGCGFVCGFIFNRKSGYDCFVLL